VTFTGSSGTGACPGHLSNAEAPEPSNAQVSEFPDHLIAWSSPLSHGLDRRRWRDVTTGSERPTRAALQLSVGFEHPACGSCGELLFSLNDGEGALGPELGHDVVAEEFGAEVRRIGW
jgi:hypothetical protein